MTTPRALREGAEHVARALRAEGFEAFFAGGCVRDLLLGEAPKDYDITTDATPEQVASVFRRTVMVGAAFGVVKVIVGQGLDYEVATYRSDGVYSDGRRPDRVAYSKTAREDVERRDFTINALLMDPRTGEVVDHVGGREDLDARLIRAVGDPQRRFGEDRLRMLRAVRFAARLGFEIDPATLTAIKTHASALGHVSVERISSELSGVIASARPGLGFSLLVDTGLLGAALPAAVSRDAAALARLEAALARLPEVCGALSLAERVIVGWGLLFEGLEPKAAEGQLRHMKLSKAQMRAVKDLLEVQAILTEEGDPRRAEAVRLIDAPEVDCRIAFLKALFGSESRTVAQVEAVRRELDERPLPARPIIGGADLARLGLAPGPHFKALLLAVDDAVLRREIVSKDEALEFVRERRERG